MGKAGLKLQRHRIGKGKVDLAKHDPAATPGCDDKEEGRARVAELRERLVDLQELLWANARQRLLVVLQGMDASGKDGVVRKVFEGVNPQGVRVVSFKAPTAVELAHDFLWRVHAHAPQAGDITIFNRSHYEDVLVVRVHELVPAAVWEQRYDQINAFERLLTESGTTILSSSSTSRRTSSGSGCRSGSTTRTSAGSSSTATWRSAHAGTTT